jgi:ssRNA-specific RNase YbeY (16S rRNA maturation enzyme)
MAKKNGNTETEPKKNWKEGELVMTFKLNPIREYQTPLMQEWLNAPLPTFDIVEQSIFDKYLLSAIKNINGLVLSLDKKDNLLGEIFICYPQAVLLAAERNKKVETVIEQLIKHGIENVIK